MSYAHFSLHANTVIPAHDRVGLERLCRYIQRPVIAKDRLRELEDGRFHYAFKREWKNGTRGIYFEGPDCLERLAALIPPPRKHQTRYHGIYAPNSRFQSAVKRLTALSERGFHEEARERRYVYWVLWAELLKRTFSFEVERCPECSGSMQRIAFIHSPEGISGLLGYDESARGPPD